jgi:hypothetical protein
MAKYNIYGMKNSQIVLSTLYHSFEVWSIIWLLVCFYRTTLVV